jgi:hypothetical protein
MKKLWKFYSLSLILMFNPDQQTYNTKDIVKYIRDTYWKNSKKKQKISCKRQEKQQDKENKMRNAFIYK